MNALFQKNVQGQSQKNDYTAKDIEVLEGLEPVRKRPGMYIGGTDEKALHHLAAEVLDNAMDEAVAGFANKIEVIFNEDYSLTIRDNGRGIPIDPHPKFPNLSALEVILTTLHSGGKFTNKVYETSGGLHGVGVSVVNALSDRLEVEVSRQRQCWRQSYSRGKSVSPLTLDETPSNRRGTSITFHPDPEIFGNLKFSPTQLFQMVRSKVYLFKGVKIEWVCLLTLPEDSKIPTKATLHAPNGLGDYLRDMVPCDDDSAHQLFFSGDALLADHQGRVEWAITWPDVRLNEGAQEHFYEGQIMSFCNTIPTPQGGTHEQGLRQALTRSLKDFGDRINNKRTQIMTAEDVNVGVVGALSCFIQQPHFQGQTKEKLVSVQATKLVDNAIKDHFDHWLTQHPQVANLILDYVLTRADERLKKRQAKEVARASATRKLRLPGKLADCSSTNANQTEIFLVEGESAGGSAKQARNRLTQAVLPLKGKILNVASASLEKLQTNQEVSDLILALGCGSGKNCDPSKLRYGKIIIMTDADVDGAHIASLLMTFFYQEMRPLMEQGHIYIAQPPLYRLTYGQQTVYARNDAERDHFLKTKFGKATKVDISRFKGLGEMPVDQLRQTTMDITKRTLLRVSLTTQDGSTEHHHAFVQRLMGKNPEERFYFIQENAKFTTNLDV